MTFTDGQQPLYEEMRYMGKPTISKIELDAVLSENGETYIVATIPSQAVSRGINRLILGKLSDGVVNILYANNMTREYRELGPIEAKDAQTL